MLYINISYWAFNFDIWFCTPSLHLDGNDGIQSGNDEVIPAASPLVSTGGSGWIPGLHWPGLAASRGPAVVPGRGREESRPQSRGCRGHEQRQPPASWTLVCTSWHHTWHDIIIWYKTERWITIISEYDDALKNTQVWTWFSSVTVPFVLCPLPGSSNKIKSMVWSWEKEQPSLP